MYKKFNYLAYDSLIRVPHALLLSGLLYPQTWSPWTNKVKARCLKRENLEQQAMEVCTQAPYHVQRISCCNSTTPELPNLELPQVDFCRNNDYFTHRIFELSFRTLHYSSLTIYTTYVKFPDLSHYYQLFILFQSDDYFKKKKRYFWPKYHEMSLRSLGKTPSSNLQKKHCKTFLKLHIICYLLCYLLSLKFQKWQIFLLYNLSQQQKKLLQNKSLFYMAKPKFSCSRSTVQIFVYLST